MNLDSEISGLPSGKNEQLPLVKAPSQRLFKIGGASKLLWRVYLFLGDMEICGPLALGLRLVFLIS